jgi:hypothetical protein
MSSGAQDEACLQAKQTRGGAASRIGCADRAVPHRGRLQAGATISHCEHPG